MTEYLANGTKVRAVCRRTGKGDYNTLAIIQREKHDGGTGNVTDYSNSHGLCYEVTFKTGLFRTESAWFDPEELTVL